MYQVQHIFIGYTDW